MKIGLSAAFLATTMIVGSAGVASASTFTVLDYSTQGIGNQADVFAAGYGANLPASWFSSDPTVTPPPGNSSGNYQSPFNNTTLQDTRSYYSVGGSTDSDGTSTTPVTLNFGSAVTSFNLLWGSIDQYNVLTFSDGSSYTGTDIVNGLTISGSSPNYEDVALVKFSFDTPVTFASFASSSPAFEFAVAPVPVPAAGLMLLGALGGLAMVRRKRKSA